MDINDTRFKSWFGRDRAHVSLECDAGMILEIWDDEVFNLVEDGFLSPAKWHQSMYDYAVYIGAITE